MHRIGLPWRRGACLHATPFRRHTGRDEARRYPDPVLHGSSAIELYTGGLWSAADLDLYTMEPRPLIAELFGMGFRWAERPRRGEAFASKARALITQNDPDAVRTGPAETPMRWNGCHDRIVTTTYRYKRPTKKRKAVAREGSAVVTTATSPRRKPAPDAPSPANNDAPAKPAPAAAKPAIATSISRKRSSGRRSRSPTIPRRTPPCGHGWSARNGATGQPDDPDAHPRAPLADLGNYPLPTGDEALDEPFAAFPRGSYGSSVTAAARCR